MCTITKIYKNQKDPSVNDINKIISHLIDGRGRDAFSVTAFSNSEIISIYKTVCFNDVKEQIISCLKNNQISKIIIYSRAQPETEINLTVNDIQPIKLSDNGMLYHHGIINKINNVKVPDDVLDTVYLATIYDSFNKDLNDYLLSPDNIILIEYPGDENNQNIIKLAWYKYDYNSNCINSIYTNVAESEEICLND